MMYGSAFDTLNGHGQGLGYLAPDPSPSTAWVASHPRGTPGPTIDITLSCGIDQNGNSWVMFNNQFFSSMDAINSFLTIWGNSGSAPFDISNPGAKAGYYMLQGAVATANNLRYWRSVTPITVSDVIGQLRAAGVPFTAYQPPPPPVIAPPAPDIVPPAPPPPPPTANYAPPPGYAVMPAAWSPRAYPIYGTVPQFNSDGTTTFYNATSFYGLTPPTGRDIGKYQAIGLDPTKLAAGLYAYKETDLGPIMSPANRRYELYMFTVIDLIANKILGPFFETTEGGGGGLLISDPVGLVSRIITDVSTFGTAEAARAAAQAAGVSQANIDLATEAGAALAIAIATVGTGIVLSATPTVAATAFPIAADAGSATASLILPTTVEVAAMDAAGATLLPASLSLVAPLSIDAAVVTGAEIAAAPLAAADTPLVPASVTTAAGGVATKAATAIGTTALAAGIKKITGQLPGAKPPTASAAAPDGTAQTTAPAASSAIKWGLGILAAALILKRKTS